jgi:hypothetical protein
MTLVVDIRMTFILRKKKDHVVRRASQGIGLMDLMNLSVNLHSEMRPSTRFGLDSCQANRRRRVDAHLGGGYADLGFFSQKKYPKTVLARSKGGNSGEKRIEHT